MVIGFCWHFLSVSSNQQPVGSLNSNFQVIGYSWLPKSLQHHLEKLVVCRRTPYVTFSGLSSVGRSFVRALTFELFGTDSGSLLSIMEAVSDA